MADTLSDILNFAVPALLLLIALGFVWIKFLQPWVVPMLAKFWEWLQGTSREVKTKREISYE